MKCLILVLMAGTAGCGGGGGGGDDAGDADSSSSGISRTTTLVMLTPTQAGMLCEWANGKQGGYGRSVDCPGAQPQMTDDSKTSCLSVAARLASICPALTIAKIEDCTDATGPDLCALTTAPACAPVRNCASAGGDSDAGAN